MLIKMSDDLIVPMEVVVRHASFPSEQRPEFYPRPNFEASQKENGSLRGSVRGENCGPRSGNLSRFSNRLKRDARRNPVRPSIRISTIRAPQPSAVWVSICW